MANMFTVNHSMDSSPRNFLSQVTILVLICNKDVVTFSFNHGFSPLVVVVAVIIFVLLF